MSALFSFMNDSPEEQLKKKEEAERKHAEELKAKRADEMRKSVTAHKKVPEGGIAKAGPAFTQTLDKSELDQFRQVSQLPFSQQAVHFLNAYWDEVGDQAEFIFTMAWETMKYADMHTKGVMYVHLYEEGNDVDLNVALYFYEQLCKRVFEEKNGEKYRNDPAFKPSMPELLTAVVRKQELREKVDVDFDGRVSFLEYLLYQYKEFCNPFDFVQREQNIVVVESEKLRSARKALEDVNAAIRAYEAEKQRLEDLANSGSGVKALAAKNQLAQLNASPIAEQLQVALVKAEAAVRMVTKELESEAKKAKEAKQDARGANPGGVFWMNADLNQKKAMYGKKQ